MAQNRQQQDSPTVARWVMHLAVALARRLPRRLGYAIVERVARSVGRLSPRQRAKLESNLAAVLGPDDPRLRRRVALEAFAHALRAYYELFFLPLVPDEELREMITFEEPGWSQFEEAGRRGKGIVFVGTHQSSFDLAGQAVAVRGYKMLVLGLPPPSHLYTTLQEQRGSRRLRVVPVGPRALREALRALRRGEVVVVSGDRPLNDQGTVVEFFGRPTLLPDGHVRLALHTGAALICAHTRREEGKYWLRLCPLEVTRSGDDEADVQENCQRLAAVLEQFIRSHPQQWHLFQRLWQ